jgi:hypothetical protein
MSVWTQSVKIGDLYYTLSGEGEKATATVTSEKIGVGNYTSLTSVVVPSSVTYNEQTYTVKAIDQMAFNGCTQITSVTIAGTVTEIGMLAFSSCTGIKSFTCDAVNPPELGISVFAGVSTGSIPLIVPVASVSKYQAALQWKDFKFPTNYTITVNSSDETKGSVSGGGIYAENTSRQISATPQPCFAFEKWNDGNTDNPRTIQVTGNKTYTAQFVPAQYTIRVEVDDPSTGSVSVSK